MFLISLGVLEDLSYSGKLEERREIMIIIQLSTDKGKSKIIG
jgi:hypothetical protein